MSNATSRIEERLRALPELQPPAGAWQQIAARHRAGVSADRRGRRRRWLAAAACVAAVGLLVMLTPETIVPPSTDPEGSRIAQTVPPLPDVQELERLRRQSQQLEIMLAGLPRQPAVMRADTAAVIGELEDRIAGVDYQLNYARAYQQPAPDLWRQRVRLMDKLVRARYAEAGADGL